MVIDLKKRDEHQQPETKVDDLVIIIPFPAKQIREPVKISHLFVGQMCAEKVHNDKKGQAQECPIAKGIFFIKPENHREQRDHQNVFQHPDFAINRIDGQKNPEQYKDTHQGLFEHSVSRLFLISIS
jgi:hypothetical protein